MSKGWKQACQNFAGGVNSPVRAFKSVGGEPVLMAQGKGAALWDSEGKSYIDFCMSWGAMLLGHADPKTVKAVQDQAAKGTSFGTATEYETRLALQIKKAFPSIERLRFTSSGTEAVMSAIRLARGWTGRDTILKFEGCYHGHADSLLVKAGSGLATFGTPDSAGVPKALAAMTATLPYNDVPALRHFFKKRKDIACVIVEPVAGNMGVVPGKQEFLDALRVETKKSGALLIFDEVISGFRVGYGGAQHLYGIKPDLTILGKIIGGGLPVGAFGGNASLMEKLSPTGDVYQAGTLSGNPLSMVAGFSVLSRLNPSFYHSLNQKTGLFLEEVRSIFKKHGQKALVQSQGSMFTLFLGGEKIENFSQAKRCDAKTFARFFHLLVKHGIYIPPSLFESYFLSSAHRESDLALFLKSLDKTLKAL